MAHVPVVPDFTQYSFTLGDTDAAITKDNGRNAALQQFGGELRQTMATLNEDLDQVAQDKQAAATSASEALAYRNQTQEISETGLPPKSGNAGKVLKVAGDEARYELGELEAMLAAVFRQMVPAGMVAGFPMTAPPTGWLKCNGAAVSRTTYADLFAAIGTRFGAGNGSTTFNVPDYRGEFPRWLDDGRGVDNNRGIAQHQGDQNREHAHGASASNDTHNHSGYTQYDGQHSHSGNTNQAGGHAHEIDLYANSGSSPNRTGAGQGGYLYKGSTNQAGAHAHSLNINSNGNHRHYFTTDNDTHGHTITINSAGGNEARPRNMPLLACIRY